MLLEWYNRRHQLVSVGLLVMLALSLLSHTGVVGDIVSTLARSRPFNLTPFSVQNISGASQLLQYLASARIVRINSADRVQYTTTYEYQVWSWSSCSGISLEEVMNAYGRHYIASDVLQVEQRMGIWNVREGLTGGEAGLARAAAQFGFQADPHPPRTLQDLIDITNGGAPVIVGIPGHIMVVKGGDAHHVSVVDSSPTNRTLLTRAQFTRIWTGFSVLIRPA